MVAPSEADEARADAHEAPDSRASAVRFLRQRDPDEICRKAGIPLLLAPSIKAGLDIDWSDPKQKAMAVDVVERQVSSLQRWVDCHLDDVVSEPLRPYIEAIKSLVLRMADLSSIGTSEPTHVPASP